MIGHEKITYTETTVSLSGIVILLIWALIVGGLAFFTVGQERRINDLEERVTTFETVRIEIVAPPADGG